MENSVSVIVLALLCLAAPSFADDAAAPTAKSQEELVAAFQKPAPPLRKEMPKHKVISA